ncbi:MAG: hypothetical protein U0263_38080 [Polyangiaceae bacterium]
MGVMRIYWSRPSDEELKARLIAACGALVAALLLGSVLWFAYDIAPVTQFPLTWGLLAAAALAHDAAGTGGFVVGWFFQAALVVLGWCLSSLAMDASMYFRAGVLLQPVAWALMFPTVFITLGWIVVTVIHPAGWVLGGVALAAVLVVWWIRRERRPF